MPIRTSWTPPSGGYLLPLTHRHNPPLGALILSKHLGRLRGSVNDLSTIVYLSVLLGVVLPAGAAWLLLVRPTRPPVWVHIALACGVGTAIALLALGAEWIVKRWQKATARAKAVS